MEVPKSVYHKDNSVSIWFFESEYCQSKYGPYSATGTNSCTLIALLAANNIAKKKVDVLLNSNFLNFYELIFCLQTTSRGPRLPSEVVDTFSKSINDGNHTYGKLLKNKHLQSMNLSIPEALDALGSLITDVEEWVN